MRFSQNQNEWNYLALEETNFLLLVQSIVLRFEEVTQAKFTLLILQEQYNGWQRKMYYGLDFAACSSILFSLNSLCEELVIKLEDHRSGTV
jgi:uncharacterized membrane protein YkvI